MFGILKTIFSALSRADFSGTPVQEINVGVDALDVELQIQDDFGNWRTLQVTRNISALIIAGMRQLASQFPGKRVRAISNGRIVDIL